MNNQFCFNQIVAYFKPGVKLGAEFEQSDIERSLRESYRDQCLTDCLEILERQGFRGISALFILSLVGGEA